jgi:hypothetical protein
MRSNGSVYSDDVSRDCLPQAFLPSSESEDLNSTGTAGGRVAAEGRVARQG